MTEDKKAKCLSLNMEATLISASEIPSSTNICSSLNLVYTSYISSQAHGLLGMLDIWEACLSLWVCFF